MAEPQTDAWRSAAELLREGGCLDADALAGLGIGRDRVAGELLGLVWDELRSHQARAHVDAGDRHHQPMGLVHGGVWCAVVESVASVAASVHAVERGQTVVGVSNQTDLLRPHRTGRVDAVAEPIHIGRTQQLWQVDLTRASDGVRVARGQLRLANVSLGHGGGS